MMQATLAELAALVEGVLTGNGDLVIHGAAALRDAGPGQITLVDGDERNHDLASCRAAAVVEPKESSSEGLPAIQVDDVHHAFEAIITHFRPPRQTRRLGVSPLAVISPTAALGDGVELHPLATIGDDVTVGDGTTIHSGVHVMAGCQIGEGVTIFPNAVLYEDTIVGPRCILHAA